MSERIVWPEPSISVVIEIQEDSCVLKSADELKPRRSRGMLKESYREGTSGQVQRKSW